MKTKLTVLVTMLMLAVGAFFYSTPAQAGLLSLPTSVGHSERWCGSHRPHHCHYWSCEGREFWCPGHFD